MYYDAVIVGGGCVGASLALTLAQLNYRVLLVEKKNSNAIPEDFAARTVALSAASVKILKALDTWLPLVVKGVPIHQVRVSVKGQFGSSGLKHHSSALGVVLSLAELETTLYQALKASPQVTCLRPATLVHQENSPAGWRMTVQDDNQQHQITTALLVAADGIESSLRAAQAIAIRTTDYSHYAILTNVRVKNLDPHTAIERFLPQGAIALLPWRNSFTCIWTVEKQKAQSIIKLTSDEFLQACQAQLGNRTVTLTACGERTHFPLRMHLAHQQIGARFLLMGNAAHNLHPIAAQGLNLSLRDIWQIRTQLMQSQNHCDLGSAKFLAEYVEQRALDQNQIIFATDKIARYMSGGPLPVWLRALGITLFDSLLPLKAKFTRISMGLP